MSLPEIEFHRDEFGGLFFQLPLNKLSERDRRPLKNGQAQSQDSDISAAAPIVTFFCDPVPQITDNQKRLFAWIWNNQLKLLKSSCDAISAYYLRPEWKNWKPGNFIGDIPPPPELRDGTALIDNVQIKTVFLHPVVNSFGVLLEVVWSDEPLGIRYDECIPIQVGSAAVACL